MSEAKKRYMVGPEGAFFDGRLWGQGQIIECEPKQRSKTWKEVDKDGNIIEPAQPATEAPQRAGAQSAPAEPEEEPKSMFGSQKAEKAAAKRRGEE